MSEQKPVHIHSEMHLEIKHRKLWAIQISPENFPRISHMFRDYAICYDIPHPSEEKDPKLTLYKNTLALVTGATLDYLVWGPGEKLHVIAAEQFNDIYQITEEIK